MASSAPARRAGSSSTKGTRAGVRSADISGA
jgi:hypothetical protein